MAANPIVIAPDLEAYQGGDPNSLIEQATALVRDYCRWHVTPVISGTVTLNGGGRKCLGIRSMLVSAVASVVEDGKILIVGVDYDWSASGYLERLGRAYWSSNLRSVTVTFTHGFDSAPVVAATILSVVSRAQKSPDGVVQTQIGPVSESPSQTSKGVAGGVSLVPHEKSALDRYRIPVQP